MNKKLTQNLPNLPGIYLFKDATGSVIYIGKAKSLCNRVRSYFQKNSTDWKISLLMQEYADLDFIITHTETEAMLLEAQLIKQYQPKFNILLKSGQPFVYIVFNNDQPLPHIELVRTKQKKGTYFGPFLHKSQARSVVNFLKQTFKLNPCTKKIAHGCLDYHLGTCPGSCMPNFNPTDYLFRLELAQEVLRQDHTSFLKNLDKKITEHNKALEFEKARTLNQYRTDCERIFATIKADFSETKFAKEITNAIIHKPTPPADAHQLAQELQDFLHTKTPIRTIDCFDISHFQSKEIVASCIRFTDGIPDKNLFRRFKIHTIAIQNDYAALQEAVMRRYKDTEAIPDLVLIDGGIGQLNAVRQVIPHIPCVSLAKREERLYAPTLPDGKTLDVKTNVGKLLIALRDYAHHFAITYHRLRRKKAIHT